MNFNSMTMKTTMRKRRLILLFMLTALLTSYGIVSFGQPDGPDYWYETNDGFGKCPEVGESGSYGTWYKDNFDVLQFSHKKGRMYANIEYKTPSSQYPTDIATQMDCSPHPQFDFTSCGRRIYSHDPVEDKWKVEAKLTMTSAYYDPYMMTNGQDIIILGNYGHIYLLNPLAPNGDGWEEITAVPIRNNQLWRLTGNTGSVDWRNVSVKAFIGDTLFMLIQNSPDNCTGTKDPLTYAANYVDPNKMKEQGIIKWNYKTGTISYDSIGAFPNAVCESMSHQFYEFADHIAGRFSLFAGYRDAMGVDSCTDMSIGKRTGQQATVRMFWTWDPARRQWFNISRGPNYTNFTGSACGRDGGFYPSWDMKKMYVTTQQGIYISTFHQLTQKKKVIKSISFFF